ncbi:hypothetical protein BC831DRAFT_504076 [Entophlyctis helioformis]|nr:hypothetical protein BC831DRAFT_504076 [Entophlyctis helioformis]
MSASTAAAAAAATAATAATATTAPAAPAHPAALSAPTPGSASASGPASASSTGSASHAHVFRRPSLAYDPSLLDMFTFHATARPRRPSVSGTLSVAGIDLIPTSFDMLHGGLLTDDKIDAMLAGAFAAADAATTLAHTSGLSSATLSHATLPSAQSPPDAFLQPSAVGVGAQGHGHAMLGSNASASGLASMASTLGSLSSVGTSPLFGSAHSPASHHIHASNAGHASNASHHHAVMSGSLSASANPRDSLKCCGLSFSSFSDALHHYEVAHVNFTKQFASANAAVPTPAPGTASVLLSASNLERIPEEDAATASSFPTPSPSPLQLKLSTAAPAKGAVGGGGAPAAHMAAQTAGVTLGASAAAPGAGPVADAGTADAAGAAPLASTSTPEAAQQTGADHHDKDSSNNDISNGNNNDEDANSNNAGAMNADGSSSVKRSADQLLLSPSLNHKRMRGPESVGTSSPLAAASPLVQQPRQRHQPPQMQQSQSQQWAVDALSAAAAVTAPHDTASAATATAVAAAAAIAMASRSLAGTPNMEQMQFRQQQQQQHAQGLSPQVKAEQSQQATMYGTAAGQHSQHSQQMRDGLNYDPSVSSSSFAGSQFDQYASQQQQSTQQQAYAYPSHQQQPMQMQYAYQQQHDQEQQYAYHDDPHQSSQSRPNQQQQYQQQYYDQDSVQSVQSVQSSQASHMHQQHADRSANYENDQQALLDFRHVMASAVGAESNANANAAGGPGNGTGAAAWDAFPSSSSSSVLSTTSNSAAVAAAAAAAQWEFRLTHSATPAFDQFLTPDSGVLAYASMPPRPASTPAHMHSMMPSVARYAPAVTAAAAAAGNVSPRFVGGGSGAGARTDLRRQVTSAGLMMHGGGSPSVSSSMGSVGGYAASANSASTPAPYVPNYLSAATQGHQPGSSLNTSPVTTAAYLDLVRTASAASVSASAATSLSASLSPPKPATQSPPTAAAQPSGTGMHSATTIGVRRGNPKYKCPRPYCSKVYKNANGLKYHLGRGNCEFDVTASTTAASIGMGDGQGAGLDLQTPPSLPPDAVMDIKISHRPYWCRVCGRRTMRVRSTRT